MTSGAAKAHQILAYVVLGAVALQFFLAGLGVFGATSIGRT